MSKIFFIIVYVFAQLNSSKTEDAIKAGDISPHYDETDHHDEYAESDEYYSDEYEYDNETEGEYYYDIYDIDDYDENHSSSINHTVFIQLTPVTRENLNIMHSVRNNNNNAILNASIEVQEGKGKSRRRVLDYLHLMMSRENETEKLNDKKSDITTENSFTKTDYNSRALAKTNLIDNDTSFEHKSTSNFNQTQNKDAQKIHLDIIRRIFNTNRETKENHETNSTVDDVKINDISIDEHYINVILGTLVIIASIILCFLIYNCLRLIVMLTIEYLIKALCHEFKNASK